MNFLAEENKKGFGISFVCMEIKRDVYNANATLTPKPLPDKELGGTFKHMRQRPLGLFHFLPEKHQTYFHFNFFANVEFHLSARF